MDGRFRQVRSVLKGDIHCRWIRGSCRLRVHPAAPWPASGWDIEPFGEPAINGREAGAGFARFAVRMPKVGKAGGGAQFPQFGALILRNLDRAVEALLDFGKRLSARAQQFAFDAV